ncbi:NADP-dependent oxidoreductase domain-containing protein [Fusarium oxysporum f. sp. albedinis]|nr:NADP-dependent oxidoreductase domain-containing protein [Fusarium oxysporum f. sp. albedinis]
MSTSESSKINIVLGVANVGDGNADPMVRFHEPSDVIAFLNAFTKRGYTQIDTARIYSPHAPGTSEPKIGAIPEKNFIIDTKVNSFHDGAHSKENILKDINDSLNALRIQLINIEYLHQPDRATDLKEACEAMDQAHKEGKIKCWGISKHTAQEVETIVKICQEHDFVKPSVYQGEYNPIARSAEKELFPILRRHGIAFYAFSPAGAGFFAGNHKNVRPGGRFDQSLFLGGLYSDRYLKPSISEATEKALAAASRHRISGHAAALRWTAHHGSLSKELGDSIIIGASSLEQLNSNIDAIEDGPLPDDVADALGAVYAEIGDILSYHVVHNAGPEALRESKREARSYSAQVAHARARKLRGPGKAAKIHEGNGPKTEKKHTIKVLSPKGQPLNQTLLPYNQATLTTAELHIHQPILSPYINFLSTLTNDECFMFDHYIKIVMPHLSAHCPIARSLGQYHEYLRRNWIIISSHDAEFIRGFLLAASRHLSVVESNIEFEEIAIRYKLEHLAKLRKDVSMQPMSINPRSVSSALVLSFDEVSLSIHIWSLHASREHSNGIATYPWGSEYSPGSWRTPVTGPEPVYIIYVVHLCPGRPNRRLGLGFEV